MCCVLSKGTVIQFNLLCTLLVFSSRLTLFYNGEVGDVCKAKEDDVILLFCVLHHTL